MVGEVSEDGNWVWDGQEWVPNTSEPEPPIQSTASENVEPSVEVSSTPVPHPEMPLPGNSMPLPAFDPNFQLPLPVSQGSQVPIVMRTLSGVTSILMSIVLLLFIIGFVIWLAAAITILSLLFTITAFYIAGATNDYNDTCDTEIYDCSGITKETAFDQDAMISGYCSFFALLLVGIFSLIQRSASMGNSQTQPVQVSGVENKQPMNKMLVLAAVLIVIVAGIALSLKSPSGGGNDSEPVEYYSFSVVDAWDAEPMDDGGDNALIVVRMTDMNGRLEHYEMVEVLMVMSDGTPARCYWSGLDRDTSCEFDDLDADGDMMFGVGDGLLVYEKGEDLCSGGTESNPMGCEIALNVRIGNAMGDMSYMSDTLSGYADPVDED